MHKIKGKRQYCNNTLHPTILINNIIYLVSTFTIFFIKYCYNQKKCFILTQAIKGTGKQKQNPILYKLKTT